MNRQSPPTASPAARFVGGVFGFAFAGIGVTLIVWLWSMPFGEFGSPPLVFRIFGSFIAIVFVAVGGSAAYSAVTAAGRTEANSADVPRAVNSGANPPAPYVCPHCGAPLADGADVSPLGDVKCTFCSSWFNVRR